MLAFITAALVTALFFGGLVWIILRLVWGKSVKSVPC